MSFSRPLTVTDLSSGEGYRSRRNRVRKGDHALRMSEKRAEQAKQEKVAAFFTREEHKALSDALFRRGRVDPAAVSAYTTLTTTVPTKRSGFVAVSPDAERAGVLAKALRAPGVNGFCFALMRLDQISGRAQPAGRPVDMHITSFLEILAKLEAAAAEAVHQDLCSRMGDEIDIEEIMDRIGAEQACMQCSMAQGIARADLVSAVRAALQPEGERNA